MAEGDLVVVTEGCMSLSQKVAWNIVAQKVAHQQCHFNRQVHEM